MATQARYEPRKTFKKEAGGAHAAAAQAIAEALQLAETTETIHTVKVAGHSDGRDADGDRAVIAEISAHAAVQDLSDRGMIMNNMAQAIGGTVLEENAADAQAKINIRTIPDRRLANRPDSPQGPDQPQGQ